GLVMLGGRSSFGPGGWGGTKVGQILPVDIHPGDGQIEPENGLKVLASPTALDNYVLRLGPTRAESQRIWDSLPPITGANQLGRPKDGANLLAQTPDRQPLMVSQEVPQGRVLIFAGETWVWARASEESREAHRRFWRQSILWLAHKEDQGEDQIKLSLDTRRIALGQKVELTVIARDAKKDPIPDVQYETKIIGPDGKEERIDPLFHQGTEARATYFAHRAPGEYKVVVTGTAKGKDLGRDSARFFVYQDDRELENPAADRALLNQIAELTGGKALQPEQLGGYLKSLDTHSLTETTTQREYQVWDNWPFFLIFTALLTFEWWLRKRMGWV
ncbi:MAG: hypothetical protein IRY99_25755, partial [Isosphaeraceae bacterium]|nr:hypothetical protein [Isosphaeraceae bacterium]